MKTKDRDAGADRRPLDAATTAGPLERVSTGEDARALVGAKFGNYVALGLLGQGGMGTVYRAEHPEIRRKVAVKVLSSALAEIKHAAGRFLSEAQAVTRIQHPSVIDIYDFGRLDDGRPFYVMELLRGRPLSERINDVKKMTPEQVLPYLRQICAGLQAAHDQGIVHRDLKPENIYVLDQEPLALKILDFGIAKLLEGGQSSQTATGVVMGTPLVIAPEQAAGHPDLIGPHTDLYSLGVILYWMISGHPPFTDDAPGLLLSRHMSEAPRDLQELEPSIAPGVAAVVHSCLEKEPHRRPRSAAAVARLFAQALEGRAVEVESAPPARAVTGTDRVSTTLPLTTSETIPHDHPAGEAEGAGPRPEVATSQELRTAVASARGAGLKVGIGLAAAAGLALVFYLATRADPAEIAPPGQPEASSTTGGSAAAPAGDMAGQPAAQPQPRPESSTGAAARSPDAGTPVPAREATPTTTSAPKKKAARAPPVPPKRVRARPARAVRDEPPPEPAPVATPTPAPAPASKPGPKPSKIGEGTIDPYATP